MSKKNRTKPQQVIIEKDSGWLASVLSLGGSFVMALVAIGVYSHFTDGFNGTAQAAGQEKAGIGVVVVDSKAILTAYMDQVKDRIANGEDFSEQKLEASGASFGADYLRSLKTYRDSGYVVIDKKYALGVPDGVEVTEKVGEALNLDVEVTADPFSFVASE